MSDSEKKTTKKVLSRRSFLKGSATAGLASMTFFGALSAYAAKEGREPIFVNAEGVILADPSRCVGCRRCESACTEFNDGKSHPLIARIKIYRNLNFGPQGVQYSYWRNPGKFGNSRIIQETCKQCAHPVPCASACPNGAIEADSITGARIINQNKCQGCGICTRACPWSMPSIDPDTQTATKCFLCNGHPECVHACPSGALRYISWRDLTKETGIQKPSFPVVPSIDCTECH